MVHPPNLAGFLHCSTIRPRSCRWCNQIRRREAHSDIVGARLGGLPFPASPLAFQCEPFSGRNMRVSLEETQKADIGRKYARKDKRPLDPPPVVRLRCYETLQLGAGHQVEQELHDVDEHLVFGLICHVDLFQLPAGGQHVPDRRMGAPSTRGSSMRQLLFDHDASMPSDRPAQATRPLFMPATHFDVGTTPGLVFFDAGRVPGSWPMRTKVSSSPPVQLPAAPGSAISEQDETCTDLLAGETFVPCSVVEHEGQRAAMFVFSDLAVRQEGRFFVRYRVFNICGAQARQAGTASTSASGIAECYGGAFQIFSTKSFPGLSASTGLTKRLSLSGFRVNSRNRERRGWKKEAQHRSSGSSAGSARGNGTSTLGPSRALSRTPDRNPYYQLPRAVSSNNPSFSGLGGFSYTPPQYSGLFNSDAESARNALAEWQRREMRDPDVHSRGGSSSTGTDESAGTRSLW
ncbi:velvet factor-domain-containing protein [Cerioporus squamosus]|nr:velvet factor-domain-containing protein [Cerioporus squamosus]